MNKGLLLVLSSLFCVFLNAQFTFSTLQIEAEVNLGNCLVLGDIQNGNKLGNSFSVGTNFIIANYFGIGLGYNHSIAKGLDWQPTNGHFVEDTRNGALTGSEYYDQFNEFKTPDYRNHSYVQNYRTRMNDFYIGPKIYIPIGVVRIKAYSYAGFMNYNVKTNALDANGDEYDFATILTAGGGSNIKTYQALNEAMDNTYESQAEFHRSDNAPNSFQFIVRSGIGADFKLSKFILGFSFDYTITRNDLIDGQRWTEWGALTKDLESILRANVSFSYPLFAL